MEYVSNPEITSKDPTYIFYNTILRNKYILDIDQVVLFFGAAHWDQTLLTEFQKDIYSYKSKIIELIDPKKGINRNKIYNEACKIQEKWNELNVCTTDQILPLTGSLQFCELIVPSGDRYSVVPTTKINDTIGGKRKTRKYYK